MFGVMSLFDATCNFHTKYQTANIKHFRKKAFSLLFARPLKVKYGTTIRKSIDSFNNSNNIGVFMV